MNNKLNLCAFADEAGATLAEQIDALRANEIRLLEIRNVDGKSVLEQSKNELSQIRTRLDFYGISVWSLGSPIGKWQLNEPLDKQLSRFDYALEAAALLGAKNIRIFSYYLPENTTPEQCKDEVLERLSRLCEHARGSDVALCHENEKGIFGDIADRCVMLHTALPELHAVFDPANFIQCDQNTLQAFEQLKSYIRYMHIKDCTNVGKIVPAGMGAGCIAQLVDKYAHMGGEVLTLEPHLYGFSGLSSLEREGEKSAVGDLHLDSARSAFNAATDALKDIIK